MKTLPQSALVISLDLELAWGVRDHLPIARYRKNLLGVRQAIPAILRLFQQYEIHATWAAVGLLFAETREELFASLPANRPQYDHPRLSPYPDLEHLRANEAEEPCYFGASLLRQIAATPHQEIGSHSFSHFYCLEAGASLESFGDDLAAAQRAAAKRGMVLRSFVFPRNQYSAEHVAACAGNGFRTMRGTERLWFYQSRGGREQLLRRFLRLLDSYANISGENCFALSSDSGTAIHNFPSSRFLRPYAPSLRAFDPLRRRRILSAMEFAAQRGLGFHLWWHPHNFGIYLEQNLAFLGRILAHYAKLRAQYGMESLGMGELAERLDASAVAASA